MGYGVARIVGETFREPDSFLGFLWGPITMGMLLSAPVFLFGLVLVVLAMLRPALPAR
jgi:phosphatidylglycerol:prolipoprotein diacylglycerol transferase